MNKLLSPRRSRPGSRSAAGSSAVGSSAVDSSAVDASAADCKSNAASRTGAGCSLSGAGFSLQRASARLFALLLLPAAFATAAVTGTVINQTTGKPQPGATVGLNRLGQNGIELIDQAKSDAQGKFTINQDTSGRTPHLLRTAYDGVTYNHMLPPGTPTTGLTVDVYNVSKQSGDAKVSKHMILFEPAAGQMSVNETFLVANDGKTAWYDPDKGTLQTYAPSVSGRVQATCTAPGGAPIGAAVKDSGKGDYGIDFPVKPGETRCDLTYQVAYTEGAPYDGKILTAAENTYLIAPNGITLEGSNLNDIGVEPKTQAHIYGFTGKSYQIKLSGTEVAPPNAGGDSGGAEQESGPQITQIMPRIYDQAVPLLAIALGILGLGFALLYRSPQAQSAPGRPAQGGK